MLVTLDVLPLRALLLHVALRAQESELGFALRLRRAPADHVEGEPRVVLGALHGARVEHTLKVRIGLVDGGRERHQTIVQDVALRAIAAVHGLVELASAVEPRAERRPRDARGGDALAQRGTDATRAEDLRCEVIGEGRGAGQCADSCYL